MHVLVTSTAQPGDALQVRRGMPPALDGLGVHGARDQVVVRQVDPVAATDLALGGGTAGRGGALVWVEGG